MIIGIRRSAYNDIIAHSAVGRGTPWKHHKYIAIENGRYIYPEDNWQGQQERQRYANRERYKAMTIGSHHNAVRYDQHRKRSEAASKRDIRTNNFINKYTPEGEDKITSRFSSTAKQDFVRGETGHGDDDSRRNLYKDLGFSDREAELLVQSNTIEDALNHIDNPEAAAKLAKLLQLIKKGNGSRENLKEYNKAKAYMQKSDQFKATYY